MTLKNRIAFAKAYNAAPEGVQKGQKEHYQMSCFEKYSKDGDVIAAIELEKKSKEKPKTAAEKKAEAKAAKAEAK